VIPSPMPWRIRIRSARPWRTATGTGRATAVQPPPPPLQAGPPDTDNTASRTQAIHVRYARAPRAHKVQWLPSSRHTGRAGMLLSGSQPAWARSDPGKPSRHEGPGKTSHRACSHPDPRLERLRRKATPAYMGQVGALHSQSPAHRAGARRRHGRAGARARFRRDDSCGVPGGHHRRVARAALEGLRGSQGP